MSKHVSAPPTIDEVLSWLPKYLKHPLSVQLVATPTSGRDGVYAGVELHYRHADGSWGLVMREGERVPTDKAAYLTGAWLRAACRLWQRMEGLAQQDIIARYLWDADRLS